jgi:hypothetical protein
MITNVVPVAMREQNHNLGTPVRLTEPIATAQEPSC